MDKSLAQQTLDSYLQAYNGQILDVNTYQAVIRAMHVYAASAVSEAKDDDIAMVKNFKYYAIKKFIEPYLGCSEKATDFVNGATWMRDEILKKL